MKLKKNLKFISKISLCLIFLLCFSFFINTKNNKCYANNPTDYDTVVQDFHFTHEEMYWGNEGWRIFEEERKGYVKYSILSKSNYILIDRVSFSRGGPSHNYSYDLKIDFQLKDGSTKTLYERINSLGERDLGSTFDNILIDYNYSWANEVESITMKFVIRYASGNINLSVRNATPGHTGEFIVGTYDFSDEDNVYISRQAFEQSANTNYFGEWRYGFRYSDGNWFWEPSKPRLNIKVKYEYLAPYKVFIFKKTDGYITPDICDYVNVIDGNNYYHDFWMDINLRIEAYKDKNKLDYKYFNLIEEMSLDRGQTSSYGLDNTYNIIFKIDTNENVNLIKSYAYVNLEERSGRFPNLSYYYYKMYDKLKDPFDDAIPLGEYKINQPPVLTITKPSDGLTLTNEVDESGFLSSFKVEGFVRDVDNDNVTVTAEIAGVSRSMTINNTNIAKPFSFDFDVIGDEIRQGKHKLTVTAIDSEGNKDVKTINISVVSRVKHGAYVLVNEPVYYRTIYEDSESDPKYQDQYKFTHDPNYFDNSMGIMSGSGIWRSLPYNSFDKVGLFEGVYRARDNPKNNNSFAEFRKWSRESLSMIEFKVHRVPVPRFSVIVNQGAGSSTVTITDYSYDLDHENEENKGISQWEWQWKNTKDSSWTNGKPRTVTNGHDYILRLKVRDIDGDNGLGIWSDWTEQPFTTRGIDLPPVALFTINPFKASHNPNKDKITIIDQSYSPKNYNIVKWEWVVTKKSNNQIVYSGGTIPTSTQLKSGGLGLYTVSLKVRDSVGNWSNTHIEEYEVINYPPEAKFIAPEEVYRDTVIKPINNSTDADGDEITYKWYTNLNGKDYYVGNNKEPSFSIQQMINKYNISPIESISDNWLIKLIATDTLGASSTATQTLNVINHIPIAVIDGPANVGQYSEHLYTTGSYDEDTADNPLSVYRWQHIKPDGSIKTWNEWDKQEIKIYFDMEGKHAIEHWVIDQIGDVSDRVNVEVNVNENTAPKMTITNPNPNKKPGSGKTMKDLNVYSSEPAIVWRYNDLENDPQEKYSLDFYYYDMSTKEEEYIKTVTHDDTMGKTYDGDTYTYQIPGNSFERFRPIKVVGRTYSKGKWSELSNEVYFVLNDPPTGDFSLDRDPPIYYRGEPIKITGYGDDINIPQGDKLKFKYTLYKGDRKNGKLIGVIYETDSNKRNAKHTFTHQIDSLEKGKIEEEYFIVQEITDSLGGKASSKVRTFKIVNRKPTVELKQPSGSRGNPTIFSELQPVIRWNYGDADGDEQHRYEVELFAEISGRTQRIENISQNKSEKWWKVSNSLSENILYSVRVRVHDGHEWSNWSELKYFKIELVKLSDLRITGVYDITWKYLFQNSNGIPTNYIIPTSLMPIKTNSKGNPIKIGYKVDFEIDSLGLNDTGDKLEIDVEFLDKAGNKISPTYKKNNRTTAPIPNGYKTVKSKLVSKNGNRGVWKFSYYLPATTFVKNSDELVIKLNITGVKSTGVKFDYNQRTNFNGKVFVYNLKNSALTDYYIRGRN